MSFNETSFDGYLTDELIIEDGQDDESALELPAERRRVLTEKQDLPVETLHTWVKRGKIDLQPDFQRHFVWDKATASRLIESLLLDIPIPVFYISQEPDNSYAVVDGQQRLSSISGFIDGYLPDGQSFSLSGLQVLTELNGKQFRDLNPDLQEGILSSTLRVIVIQKESDPDVKFEVFKRLNLGAVRLNDQEIRNCVYRGSYNDR